MINHAAVNRCTWHEHLMAGVSAIEKARMALLVGPEAPENHDLEEMDDESSDLFLAALAHMEIARTLLKRADRAL